MDYLWRENKKFLIALGAGLAVVILYHSFVLSPLRRSAVDAAQERKREKEAHETRLKAGVPAEEVLANAKRDLEGARKALQASAAEVSFRMADRYAKPPRESAKVFADDLREKVKTELQEKAVKAGVSLPQALGFGEDAPDVDAGELVPRLAAAERLVTIAIESGVEKIEAVDALHGFEAGGRAPSAEPRKGRTPSTYPVLLRCSGKAEALIKVAHAAQRKGQYLAITQFEAARPDPTKETFDATIVAVLFRAEEKAAAEGK